MDVNETDSPDPKDARHAGLAVPRSGAGRSALLGIAGGAVATLAMSALMLAAQKVGLLGEMPPKKITRSAARFAGIFARSRGAENAATVAAHWGFGMTMGGLYALVHRRRWGLARSSLLGVGFGSAVWAASYAGWVPAAGIMRSPLRDRRFRPTTMAAAHLVFGGVLGVFVEQFSPRSTDTPTT